MKTRLSFLLAAILLTEERTNGFSWQVSGTEFERMMIAVFGDKEMCRKDVSGFGGREPFNSEVNRIWGGVNLSFETNPVAGGGWGNSRPLISRNKNQNNYVPAAIFTTTGSRRSKASFRIPLEVEKQIRRWPAAPWPNQRSAPGTSATRASSRRRSHRCCESSLSSRVQGKFPYVP